MSDYPNKPSDELLQNLRERSATCTTPLMGIAPYLILALVDWIESEDARHAIPPGAGWERIDEANRALQGLRAGLQELGKPGVARLLEPVASLVSRGLSESGEDLARGLIRAAKVRAAGKEARAIVDQGRAEVQP